MSYKIENPRGTSPEHVMWATNQKNSTVGDPIFTSYNKLKYLVSFTETKWKWASYLTVLQQEANKVC